MVLTVHLPPSLERRLAEAAARQGLSADAYAATLLEQHLEASERPAELSELLQSWLEADNPQEQIETGDLLIRTLDEDRPSARRLFPAELEGTTW